MFFTTTEAAKRFPVPISPAAVLRKIKVGNKGVKLNARFDGYRYVLTQEDIDQFVLAVSEQRKTYSAPVDFEADFALFQSLRPTRKRF